VGTISNFFFFAIMPIGDVHLLSLAIFNGGAVTAVQLIYDGLILLIYDGSGEPNNL